MKKTTKVLALSMASIILLASCASTPSGETKENVPKTEKTAKAEKKSTKGKKGKFDQEAYNDAFASGDYSSCIDMLNAKDSKNFAIKTKLDVDMLKFYTADYIGSGKSFFETQGEMQQLSADMSASKVMQAALVGEDTVEYTGTVYERLLAYSMRTVSAIEAGKMDDAQGVIYTYTGDYKDIIAPLVAQQKEIAAASEGVLNDPKVATSMEALSKVGLNLNLNSFTKGIPQKSNATYDTSAFLSYLGTVVFAANNDSDHAKDFASVLKTAAPNVDVSDDLKVPAGKGRLDIIALSGNIGKRDDSNLQPIEVFQIPSSNGYFEPLPVFFKFSYPVFDANSQNHKIDSVRVTLSSGESKNAVIVENFDNAVAIDVASKARGAFNRSIFRNITKAAVVIPTNMTALATAEATVDSVGDNPLTKKAAMVGLDKALDALKVGLLEFTDLEKADVRQGEYFPHIASTAGFTVDAGTYNVTVEYLNGSSVVETKVIENVVVEEGKVVIRVSSCLK